VKWAIWIVFELWSNNIFSVIRKIIGGNSVDTLSGVKKTAGGSFDRV